jgi:hypothetical protein
MSTAEDKKKKNCLILKEAKIFISGYNNYITILLNISFNTQKKIKFSIISGRE